MSAKSLSDATGGFIPKGVFEDTGRAIKGLYTAGLSETPVGQDVGRKVLRGLGLQAPDTSASDAAKALEEKRRAQLAAEAQVRADAKTKAETTGQRAGLGSAGLFSTGFGFGSGNTAPGNRGKLFGN